MAKKYMGKPIVVLELIIHIVFEVDYLITLFMELLYLTAMKSASTRKRIEISSYAKPMRCEVL